jgi:hypothetical protein
MVTSTKSNEETTDATKSKASNAEPCLTQEPLNQEGFQNATQTTCPPQGNQSFLDVATETEPMVTPKETTTISQTSEPATVDEAVRRQALEFRNGLARRFVRHAVPMGYSQAYLKSSTSEIKLRELPKAIDASIQTSGVTNKISTQEGTTYDLESRRNFGIGRKLQYVRPIAKEMVQPPKFPPIADTKSKTVHDNYSSAESSIFGCVNPPKTTHVVDHKSPLESDMVNPACLLDNDDTRSISPAPSDEFEQRVAYTGCDVAKLGTSEWGTGNMVSETASNIFAFQEDETSPVATSSLPAPPDEPEMIVVDVGKSKSRDKDVDQRDIEAPPSEDNSVVEAAEQRDDAEEVPGGVDNEDWMEQISTIMCSK